MQLHIIYILYYSASCNVILHSYYIMSGNDTPILYKVLRDPDISLSVHWFKYEKDPLTDTSSPREKVRYTV